MTERRPTDAELIDAIRRLKVIMAGLAMCGVSALYGLWRLFSTNSIREFLIFWVSAVALERLCSWERNRMRWMVDAITNQKAQ